MSLAIKLHKVQIRSGSERRIHMDRRKDKRIGAVDDRRTLNDRRSL